MNRLVSLRPAGAALSRRPRSSLVHINILAHRDLCKSLFRTHLRNGTI